MKPCICSFSASFGGILRWRSSQPISFDAEEALLKNERSNYQARERHKSTVVCFIAATWIPSIKHRKIIMMTLVAAYCRRCLWMPLDAIDMVPHVLHGHDLRNFAEKHGEAVLFTTELQTRLAESTAVLQRVQYLPCFRALKHPQKPW